MTKKKKFFASSVRDFKVQHPKTIIPFSEFDPDRSELKEAQRCPVRFFENLCSTLTFQFIWVQQASETVFTMSQEASGKSMPDIYCKCYV